MGKRKALAPPISPERTAAFDALVVALADYLETVGWRALVVSDPRILGSDKAYNFEFVLRFTGIKLT